MSHPACTMFAAKNTCMALHMDPLQIPSHTTDAHIRNLFGPYGTITDIHVLNKGNAPGGGIGRLAVSPFS
jgi:hypothetical protein